MNPENPESSFPEIGIDLYQCPCWDDFAMVTTLVEDPRAYPAATPRSVAASRLAGGHAASHMLVIQAVFTGLSDDLARWVTRQPGDVYQTPQGDRVFWRFTLGQFTSILSDFGCWFGTSRDARIGWPLVLRLCDEIATEFDPVIRQFVNPPCMNGDGFVQCPFVEDNKRCWQGGRTDPPCSLFLGNHQFCLPKDPPTLWGAPKIDYNEMREKMDLFRVFWDRNPWTGHYAGSVTTQPSDRLEDLVAGLHRKESAQ